MSIDRLSVGDQQPRRWGRRVEAQLGAFLLNKTLAILRRLRDACPATPRPVTNGDRTALDCESNGEERILGNSDHAALVLAALLLVDRLASSTQERAELQARAARVRAGLLSLALVHLSPPLEVTLAVEDAGIRHLVTATFPGLGAPVCVTLDALDLAARVRVAEVLARPELADTYLPRGTAADAKAPPEIF